MELHHRTPPTTAEVVTLIYLRILSLLSQEQDALYEIEEALKRVDAGTYGICEMSGKPIPHARLEAIPFARFTVECQTQIEKQSFNDFSKR
jgi:RNA polymerase-binding transcription factor DksA